MLGDLDEKVQLYRKLEMDFFSAAIAIASAHGILMFCDRSISLWNLVAILVALGVWLTR